MAPPTKRVRDAEEDPKTDTPAAQSGMNAPVDVADTEKTEAAFVKPNTHDRTTSFVSVAPNHHTRPLAQHKRLREILGTRKGNTPIAEHLKSRLKMESAFNSGLTTSQPDTDAETTTSPRGLAESSQGSVVQEEDGFSGPSTQPDLVALAHLLVESIESLQRTSEAIRKQTGDIQRRKDVLLQQSMGRDHTDTCEHQPRLQRRRSL
ncbi:hypothetical protein ACLX1H_000072 [Fusarium chlamydosporum]